MNNLKSRYQYSLKRLSFGDEKNVVIRLILINLVIFAGVFFTKMVYYITNAPEGSFVSQVIPWAVLPADPVQLFIHPWTLLTFMFVHTDFWLIFSTMIWFWGYGELMQGTGNRDFVLPLYILGGFAGAVLFILSFQFIPPLHSMQATANSVSIGAGASVTAVVVCMTVLRPKFKIFPMIMGGIPLYAITLIYLAINMLPIGGAGNVFFYSHLTAYVGGALLGGYFGYRIRQGFAPGEFVNRWVYRFSHLFEPREEEFSAENVSGRQYNPTYPYKKISEEENLDIDTILDKINKKGMGSLTKAEREALLRASRED